MIKEPKKLCESMIAIDHKIIFASVCSLSGMEIANARQPSADLMIRSDNELEKNYPSLILSAIQVLIEGEKVFGELVEITVMFRNLKMIIVLDRARQIFATAVATQDAESYRISFELSKLIAHW